MDQKGLEQMIAIVKPDHNNIYISIPYILINEV